ncbi:hypothetical protein JCM19000A_25040 [Silvimonas sp. JCM 19000]
MAALRMLAGPEALRQLREHGLKPDLFSHMGAAAGGPKWQVLARLDKALMGQWLADRSKPMLAVGASIGAWRLAALAQDDPLAALDRFEAHYLAQAYSERPSPREVSQVALQIMHGMLGETGAQQIVAHPWLHLNILTARAVRGIDGSGSRGDKLALARAVLANARARRHLGGWLQRVTFHAGPQPAQFIDDGFGNTAVPLQPANLPAALLASGAIPGVLEAVRDIPGAPRGTYLDGGLIDYHMDLALAEPQGLMLLPHFTQRITTGWLDQFLPWRKAAWLERTLVLAPTAEFVAQLPGQRIPSRKDFARFNGRDSERIAAWKTALNAGQQLADEFVDWINQPNPVARIEPLP